MTTYKPNPDYVVREIRGERLLVPIAGDMGTLDSLFTLNETATLIWDLASQGAGQKAIIQSLQDTFTVPHDEAAEDTRQILTELQALDALIPVETA